MEKALFGAGCFWGVEDFFRQVPGVANAVSGYAGGSIQNPTYKQVCHGDTNHAEVVEVTFDPAKLSYATLVDLFFKMHNPTTLNRQGPDEGTHYRSVIFYVNDEQKKLAEKSFKNVTAAGLYRDPIVTQLVPLEKFWVAEKYHQDYYRLNANKNPYCQSVIAPKMAHLKEKLAYYKAHVQKEQPKELPKEQTKK